MPPSNKETMLQITWLGPFPLILRHECPTESLQQSVSEQQRGGRSKSPDHKADALHVRRFK